MQHFLNPKTARHPSGILPLLSLLVLTSAFSTGCASLDKTPFAPLPTYKVDVYASEVTWQRSDGKAVESDKASVARVEIAEMLDELMAERADLAKAKPARFKTRIVETRGGHCDVLLIFETAGQSWTGHSDRYSAKEGVYWALRGTLPEVKPAVKPPTQFSSPASMVVGISGNVIGHVGIALGLGFSYYPEVGIPLLIGGTILFHGGIVLTAFGARRVPVKPSKKAYESPQIFFGPTSTSVRIMF